MEYVLQKEKLCVSDSCYVCIFYVNDIISTPSDFDGNKQHSHYQRRYGLCITCSVYMNYNHISRFKRASKNEEWLKKTGKHIRITKEQIVNYRIEAQEERKYEWSQVLGAYNRKEEIVLCTKKDEQIMTLDKSKLSESEMKFITDIIDERHLWRTSMPIRTVYLMFGAITFVGVTWIVQAVLKVM